MPTSEPRPKRFPPPEFPPRRGALFSDTPPAIFAPILGFLGLAGAVRLSLLQLEMQAGVGDLLSGIAVGLWAFATLSYLAKLMRRPGVLLEDLRVLPGRAGLAAMTMGGMMTATLVMPLSVGAASTILVLALLGHLVITCLLIRLLLTLAPSAREVNPTWHLSLVGLIVGAPAAMAVGLPVLTEVLFWISLPLAVAIWGLSAMQFLRVLPPAVLRPLLAIHVAPAGFLSFTAALIGLDEIAQPILLFGVFCALVLTVYGRWMLASGVTPLWGGLTFPVAALASALLVNGGHWSWAGIVLTGVAAIGIPPMLVWMLKRWANGKLAEVTNAARA